MHTDAEMQKIREFRNGTYFRSNGNVAEETARMLVKPRYYGISSI